MDQPPPRVKSKNAPVLAALVVGGLLGAGLLVFALLGLAGLVVTPIGPILQHLSPSDLASSAVAGTTLMLAVFTAFLATETRESVAATRLEAGIAAQALAAAQEQARIGAQQVNATERHAAIAQETLEASWRPLLVDVLQPENRADADYSQAGATPTGDGYAFRVRFRNVGSGPAIITRAGLHTGSAGVLATVIHSSVVAPGERTTLAFELRRAEIEARPVIANIESGNPLTVDVWYGDQGGHHRWVTRGEMHPIDRFSWKLRSLRLAEENAEPFAESGPMFPPEPGFSEDADDRAVLALIERMLRDRDNVSADEVLAELGWDADRKLPLMRAMKLLIDVSDLVGKTLTGDGTILDVTATGITEKGLNRFGLE